MAARKSKENPHQWPNGSWHSIPWTQTKQYAESVLDRTGGATSMKGLSPNAPAPAPTEPAPPEPAPVNPFWSADDLQAINAFDTDLATKLQEIDFSLGNLESDTKYQSTQLATGAKKATAQSAGEAAARGIFRSSIRDAVLNDIEAQRSLQQKFLDSTLTAARLNAGTVKSQLGDSKRRFDTAMAQKKAENARGANDASSGAWAEAMAQWQSVNRAQSGPTQAARPTISVPKTGPQKGIKSPLASGKATLSPTRPNVASGEGTVQTKKPAKKTQKVVYGKSR